MIRMKSFLMLLPVLAVTALAVQTSPGAVILVAWDAFAGVGDPVAADHQWTGFDGTLGGLDIGTIYGSSDGTFGGSITGAQTAAGGPQVTTSHIGTLTITNHSGQAYNIQSLHLDWGPRNNGPRSFAVTYTSGGLGAASTLVGAGGPDANPNSRYYDYNDYDFDLSAVLTDIRLDTGESAIFTFTFSGGGGGSNVSGLDNIAITGSPIPEPASLVLLSIGALLIAYRSRSVCQAG